MNIFGIILSGVCCFFVWFNVSAYQTPPPICLSSPPPYEIGGDFEFIVTEDGFALYKNSACTADGVATSVGVINANVVPTGSTKYLFGVDASTVVPNFEDIPASTFFSVSTANEGEFWVMQIEKRGSTFLKSCRAFTVLNPPKPPAISHLSVDVDIQGTMIRVEGAVAGDGFDFQLLEARSGDLVGISSEPAWETDDFNASEEPICFQTQYRGGICKGLSERSEPVCSIHLSQSEIELIWTSGGSGAPWVGEGYVVQEVKPTFNPINLVENITLLSTPKGSWVAEKPKTVRIVKLVSDGSGKIRQLGSNSVVVEAFPPIFFPTVFTPNNDSLNDTWGPVAAQVPSSIDLRIYNRLGQEIFVAHDWESCQWDGAIANETLPNGVYSYRFSYKWTPDAEKIKVGSFTLLR